MKKYWEFIKENNYPFNVKSYKKSGRLLDYRIRSRKILPYLRKLEGKQYLYLKDTIGLDSGDYWSQHVQETSEYIRPGMYKIIEFASQEMWSGSESAWVSMKLLSLENNRVQKMVIPLDILEIKDITYFNKEEADNFLKSKKSTDKYKL